MAISNLELRMLPIELQRIIFTRLRIKDLKKLRLTCKFLADIGAELLLPEVHVIFTAESMARLKKISLHPVFSQHVTSIFYEGDRLDHYESVEKWKKNADPRLVDKLHRPPRETIKIWVGPWVSDAEWMESQMARCWKNYRRLLEAQQKLQENDVDRREIVKAILRFPKLDTIRLSTHFALHPGSQYLKNSFKQGLLIPQGEYDLHPFEPPGLRQYDSLMGGFCRPEKFDPRALLTSGIKLPSTFDPSKLVSPLRVLHLGDISWFIFRNCSGAKLSAINASLRHLVDLKLLFTTAQGDNGDLGLEVEMCRERLDQGPLLDFVSSAPMLEKLHIEFDVLYSSRQAASLEFIVGEKTWAKLSHFTIGNVFASKAQLVSFFERHRETLQSWSILGLCLEAGADWKAALRDLRDVSHWRDVRVGGNLRIGGESHGYPSLWKDEAEASGAQLRVMRSIRLFLTRQAEEVDLEGGGVAAE